MALRPVVISDIQYRPMVGVELDHVTEWTLIRHDYTLNSQLQQRLKVHENKKSRHVMLVKAGSY